MLSFTDSENFLTLDSLIEKLRKEKNDKAIQKLNMYIQNIKELSNDVKMKENLLLYYNLKLDKIKDEYNEIYNEIVEEENNLMEKYISEVEKEEFYLSPSNLEIKDLSERARNKKNKYNKIIDDYDYAKLYMNKEEEELEENINNLTDKEKKLYNILKEYLLNDKSLNKINDDFGLLSENNNYNEIIRSNMGFIRETKIKMKNKRNEIKDLRNEVKNNYDKKTRKNVNHLNYNDNLNIVKNSHRNNDDNTSLDNISIGMLNNTCNSFVSNDDMNKTNISFQNNISTNLNKTYYLRANKSLNFSKINSKMKSCSLFLKTDSSEKYNKRNVYLCKRLLNNYCNKYTDHDKEFIFDIKLKEKKNLSMPKNPYHQRRKIRENFSDYIYINGNRYKQSLIGKATNTVNGVY